MQLLNITTGAVQAAPGGKVPVDIIFAVRDGRGYLPGSEVSEHLRKLSLVEFSFYVGFPALQIAEGTTNGFETASMCVQEHQKLLPWNRDHPCFNAQM